MVQFCHSGIYISDWLSRERQSARIDLRLGFHDLVSPQVDRSAVQLFGFCHAHIIAEIWLIRCKNRRFPPFMALVIPLCGSGDHPVALVPVKLKRSAIGADDDSPNPRN